MNIDTSTTRDLMAIVIGLAIVYYLYRLDYKAMVRNANVKLIRRQMAEAMDRTEFAPEAEAGTPPDMVDLDRDLDAMRNDEEAEEADDEDIEEAIADEEVEPVDGDTGN